MTKVSGTVLATKIAEGTLSAEEKQFLAAQREESLKKQSLWKKQQQAKKEFGRGFQIELEKENRVKAGLPEYDIQPSKTTPAKTGRGKSVSAEEIMKKQKGSEALGELRKKSRAKALVSKAEHQAATGSAKPITIHKNLKKARLLDPESVKGINEKELMTGLIPEAKTEAKALTKGNTVAEVTKETTKKSGGFFSKVGKFFKKAGKIGLIAGVIGGLIAGGVYLYNKLTGSKNAAPVPGEDEANIVPQPVEPEDKKDKVEPAPKPEDKERKPVPKDYVVKEGDCVWNIAKKHLKELNPDPNYKPTNAEILKHTKELMELNQLEFEPDGYHVMIRPNDHLKLAA